MAPPDLSLLADRLSGSALPTQTGNAHRSFADRICVKLAEIALVVDRKAFQKICLYRKIPHNHFSDYFQQCGKPQTARYRAAEM